MKTASIPEPQFRIKTLAGQLKHCLIADRYRFKKQLDRIRTEFKKGLAVEEKLSRLAAKIERSCAQRQKRLYSIPELSFPELPISEKRREIAELIRKHQVVIVCGETGSGKTTQLPKICLLAGQGGGGFIGHTQPRRIAARTVADRVAEELGLHVGYKVRFHDKTRPESLIKLMTDGILLAETQNDPYLNQYDTLIIDEAHERSLNIDFLLGYMKWLLPRRRDLKLIITSATIDPERFSRHFDNAPIVEVSGRSYPVEIRYRPIEQVEESDETSRDLQQAILDAVDELHRDIRGDILIFLSGEKEIKETAESLRKHHSTHCEILPLYAKLSVREQERVFKPKGRMRIVLATNVAETSLTVPGIRAVIDSGHARISRYSHRSKIQRLPIEKISQASANQRAGRCGRVAEGICIRLYSEDDYRNRPEFTEPEILRTNLAAVILQMKALKLGDIEHFPFIEPPDRKMIRDGIRALHEIHALDEHKQLTALGRQLVRLPIDPRLARMLLAAEKRHCLKEVAIIVAALSIQDPREKPADKLAQAESKQAEFNAEHSDFLSFLNLWNAFEQKKKQLSNNKLRLYCRERFLSYVRMREWFDVHTQIMQVIKGELKLKLNQVDACYEEIHQALLYGLLSNIGFRHERYEYLGARNLKFYIFPGSAQHKARPKWLMAAEQVETSKVYARNVAKIEPEWIECCASHLLKRNYYDPHWEKKAARCAVHERTLLYGLTLQAGRKIPYERIDAVAARELFIRSALVNQDYETRAPFFKANAELLQEVGYIQHKGRRVDLVDDEEGLYRFYDRILPPEVVNGITLDQWRKTAEKQNPKILFLSKEDLTRQQEHDVQERDFPDQMKLGALTLPLQYRFEPGHEEDGVSVVIPLHQLNQLDECIFQWLVPGLLREKLIALLKSLPKALRKTFVPVPQTVDRCLETRPEAQGSLYEWLAKRLRQLTGESVPASAWNVDALPEHLKMNFKVVDENGHKLACNRDLPALQRQFSQQSETCFEQLATDAYHFTGCLQWAFDDLPEVWLFHQNGRQFSGYPAIIDEGDSVGVRILETREKAEQLHRFGLVRLYQLVCSKEYKYLLKQIPLNAEIEWCYRNLGKHPLLDIRHPEGDYRQALLFVVFEQAFVTGKRIRKQQQFEASLDDNKSRLVKLTQAVSDCLQELFKIYAAVMPAVQQLPKNDPIRADMQEHLHFLIFEGFLYRTPFEQLKHFPRYLSAAQYRLQKMSQNRQKDRVKMQELQRFWKRYWQQIKEQAKNTAVAPEQDGLRWALEEFRVSLFAQQLKTAYPVSAKRLEKMWRGEVFGSIS